MATIKELKEDWRIPLSPKDDSLLRLIFMKFITHERDTIGDFQKRVLIHIPIGYIMGIASVIPFLGYGLVQLFLKYERNEDIHTEDQAWKDIFGAIVGYVMGIFTDIGVGVWLLLELL